MGNIGEPMDNQTVPTVGASGTNYARDITLFLTEVKQRLEDLVPLSGISLTSLDLTNNPIQNAQYLGLYEGDDPPTTPAGSVHYYNGDFWMVTATGVVKITDGTTLDAVGTGNITGDYGGANPAQWRFHDADATFYSYDDFGGGTFARVFARSFDISGDDVGSQRVRLTWAGSSSYDITLPLTAPGSQLIMQMDDTGAVTASNTLASGLVITTGSLDLQAGDITLATDRYIQLSGTGRIKHGTRTLCDQAAFRVTPGGGGVSFTNGPNPSVVITTGNQVNIHCPPVEVGMQITHLLITGEGSGPSTPPTIAVNTLASDGSLVVRAVTTTLSAGVVTGDWEYTMTYDVPWTVATGLMPVVRYTPNGAGASVYTIQAKYTSP